MGETALFWIDLTSANGNNANLIQGGFSAGAAILASPTPITIANVDLYFPKAKIGGGNSVYVWSINNANYYGLSKISTGGWWTLSAPGLTVQQANNIDAKIDDGLPQIGNVIALYVNGNPAWAGTASGTTAVSPSGTTCYDNGGNVANAVVYSVSQNGGSKINCALSFRFR